MNSIAFFKALLLKEMEEDLKGGQKKLDVAEPKGKITAADFKALRAKKGLKEQNSYQTNVELSVKEKDAIKKQLPDAEFEWDVDDRKQVVHSSKSEMEIEKIVKSVLGLKEDGQIAEGDHEVSMAHNSLESIIKSAMELKAKLGDNERDIPGWIQDHITNAENFIDQAAQGFHELKHHEEPMSLGSMMQNTFEYKKAK